MQFLRNNNMAFDPKFFLSQLGSLISKVKGKSFVVNKPHDAPEVLGNILDEILPCSALPTNLVKCSLVVSTSCTECQCTSTTEEPHTIIRIVAACSVQQAISRLQETSMLDGENMWHCPQCNEKREAIRKARFASLPTVLILQIERFIQVSPTQTIKKNIAVSYNPSLNIFQQADDELYTKCTYSLRTVVHHSGSINSGHYTASVFVPKQNKWFKCNDKAVLADTSIDKKTPYLLFYVQN
jgi:ubiquitin C-terminal hydrolase